MKRSLKGKHHSRHNYVYLQKFTREQLKRMNLSDFVFDVFFIFTSCLFFIVRLPLSSIHLTLSKLHSYNDGLLGVPQQSSTCTARKVSIPSIKESVPKTPCQY